jgi:DNA repair protein RadC
VIDSTYQPREKIRRLGPQHLTISELIALVLGNGTENNHVSDIANNVVQELRSPTLSLASLQQIKGIGPVKACQLLAMVEFVERIRPSGFPIIDSIEKVLDAVSELRTAQREHIVCLYLNTRLQLLLKETVAIGSVNQSIVAPRDIFSAIRHHPISYILLVHNHPSGNPQPSPEDVLFTRQIQRAGEILGVEMLDHVIISAKKHYSFKQHKQLEMKT